jgi:hypothetical protein
MHEYRVNLHMHTVYSDGFGSHAEIIQAALQTGLDAVIVTDHNVLVQGLEKYYVDGDRRVLLLVGEEIHDQARDPQKNHMLVIGADQELAPLAYDPQRLIDGVRQSGGLSFLAHPVDPPAPAFEQDDLGWVSWDIENFTGLEIWNSLSEFKARLKTILHALFYAYQPNQIWRGPFEEVLRKWDELTKSGKRIVGIGGSDAHALKIQRGPLRRVIFPYKFHFRGINTHLLIPEPLTGEAAVDRNQIIEALRSGHAFVGYDLPASTSGFRFTAIGKTGTAWMGDEIEVETGLTFQIRLPVPTTCRLIHNGKVVKTWEKRLTCTYISAESGSYRVEADIHYRGRQRNWIFSNPIYVRPA